MENQITQSPKSNSKGKAVASLVLGVISMTLGLMPEVFLFLGMNPMAPSPILNIVFLLPIVALFGVILGILGLKSTKRNFAIVGIVLCIIGLLVPIIFFLFY